MPRIHRYVLSECLGPTLVGLLIYTVLFLVNLVFQLAELAIRKEVPFLLLVKLLGLAMPRLLSLTVPMSILLGILIGMGRMSADSEITALRSCGVSYLQMLPPLVGLGALGTVLSFGIGVFLVPEAAYAQHRLNAEILLSGDLSRNIQPRVFFQEIPGLLLYADRVDDDGGLQDVLLVQEADDGTQQLTLAEWVKIDQDRTAGRLRIRMHRGETHSLAPARPELYERTYFADQAITRPPDQALLDFAATLRGDLPRNIRELRTLELGRRLDITDPRDPGHFPEWIRTRAELEFHRRLAVPMAAVIFALLGPPLGIVTRRGGRSTGFAISIGVTLAYWMLMSAAENVARSDIMPVWAAVWLSNVVFLVIGLVLLAWMAVDRRVPRFLLVLRRLRLPERRSPVAVAAARRPRRRRGGRGLRPRAPLLPERLDRYISGTYLRLFLLVLASFYVFHVLTDLRTLLDDITANPQVTLGLLARYFAYRAPEMILTGLPLAALLATLLAFGTLERHQEITAMKAAGVSAYRLSLPVIVVGLLLSLAHFALTDHVVPHATEQASALRAHIHDAQPASTFGHRRWLFGENGRVYNLTSYSKVHDHFQGVSIFRRDPERLTLRERIEASTARYVDGTWVLRNGWTRTFDEGGETFETFSELRLDLPETPEAFRREVRKPAQMTYAELTAHIGALQKGGYDVQELQVALYQKPAMSVVPVVLVLIGLSYSFRAGARHRGNLAGVGLAITLTIAYYVSLATFRELGAVGIVPPLVAAWGPGIIFAGVGGWRMLSLPT